MPSVGFLGLIVSLVFFFGSLITAILSLQWGAIGYAIVIYMAFCIMAFSSWSIKVRKNDNWSELPQLEQYILHRHRVFFYFPFAAANFGHFCNWTRMFAVLWAVFCIWKKWYWLAGAFALFYVVATPMIVIWIPIPHYQKLVQRGHEWAQQRLKAIQHILDERNSLRF